MTTTKNKQTKAKIDWSVYRLPPLCLVTTLMLEANPTVYKMFYQGYFQALESMNTAADQYGDDSGLSVVLYALGNWSAARSRKEFKEFKVYSADGTQSMQVDRCLYVREILKEHARRVGASV